MTRREMENRYHDIVIRDAKLDAQEQVALLNRYIEMLDAADVGLVEQMDMCASRIAGVTLFLEEMRKISDAEDLWMLMNEIESYGYRVAKGGEKMDWVEFWEVHA